MEKNVLDNADVLITNTPVMERHFIETDGKYEQKFNVIPNGYDPEDFREVQDAPANPVFTLTYAGLLYGRRKPDTFFEALDGLIKEGKIDRRNIRVNLVGNFKTAELNKRIADFSLADIVEITPYADHDLCLSMLSASDTLLLIEGTGPGAEAFYTGKVFEYMRTGRPILAVIPENGAAAGLIRETGTGLVSDYNDIDNIKLNLNRMYADWQKGIATCNPDNDRITKYDRRNLTAQLAGLFNNAISRQKKL
jgi:glycosyltransferase involved in cell wall biosynthesis